MENIDDGILRKYVTLDRKIKEETKDLKTLKDQITAFLNDRNGKELVTENYIALFQLMNRSSYEIPKEIKLKYKEITEIKILKVNEKAKSQ